MGKVIAGFSTSLDGFIADPQGEVGPLFDWYSGGDVEVTFPNDHWVAKVSAASATVIRELNQRTGAIVSGRRQFDMARGWGGRHTLDVPVFIVTHHVPQEWVYAGSPFTFVTNGVASAIAQAQAVAGSKDVGVDGANVAQQAIKAGLVDEIFIDLVPILLGAGIHFFDNLGPTPIELEQTRVVEGAGVTHLHFRIVK
ncbi:MAG TPA: dihydrofolate reductase family protein [Herpetosiphonaceae bacterium]